MPTTKLLKKGENLLWGFGKLIKKLKFGKERTNEPVAWIQGLCNLRMVEFDREKWKFD